MNRMGIYMVWTLCMGLFLGSCGLPDKTYTKEYEELFSGVKEIEIEGRFLEVSYEGREREEDVFLNAFLQSTESNGLDIKYRKSGSRLKIEVVGNSSFQGWNFGKSTKGFISLTGPENIKLNISNTSGTVEVMHISHDQINLKTNSGSIKLSELEVDDIQLSASSGNIQGKGLYGEVNAQVNSGQIKLEEVIGNIKAKGSSGSLKFAKVEGKVDAQVNSGSIRLDDVMALGELRVSSGSIRADNSTLSESTRLNANSGSIRIQTPSDLTAFNFELSASSGNVKVGDSSGKRLNLNNDASSTIRGNVSSGSIRISN